MTNPPHSNPSVHETKPTVRNGASVSRQEREPVQANMSSIHSSSRMYHVTAEGDVRANGRKAAAGTVQISRDVWVRSRS